MARFYGTLNGGRGPATRCGHAGLHTSAASLAGEVCVELFSGDGDGPGHPDTYRVYQRPHHGAGISQEIACGVIGQPLDMGPGLMHVDDPAPAANAARAYIVHLDGPRRAFPERTGPHPAFKGTACGLTISGPRTAPVWNRSVAVTGHALAVTCRRCMRSVRYAGAVGIEGAAALAGARNPDGWLTTGQEPARVLYFSNLTQRRKSP